MDRPILVHIPKTGGSTMGPVVTRHYSRTLSVGRNHVRLLQQFSSRPQAERDRYQAVVGHVRYGIHRFFSTGTPRYFTMLRHPVERTLSAYSFALEKPFQPNHARVMQITFAQYIREFQLGDKQTTWLMGYLPSPTPTLEAYGERHPLPENALDILKERLSDEFVVVGLLEQYDATLLMLQDYFGWANVYYERINTTGRRVRYSDLDAEGKRALDEWTGPDFELYDWARARFDAKIEGMGEPFQHRLRAYQAQNATFVDRRRQFATIRRQFRPKHLAKLAIKKFLNARRR